MDFDAPWTKKNDESRFGCKDHVKCDSGSKIIADFSVTDASARGSQEFVSIEVRVKGSILTEFAVIDCVCDKDIIKGINLSRLKRRWLYCEIELLNRKLQ